MKLRKLMIILILIIFLFSIASVTAANTTDVMTSNDDSSQKNDEILSKENDEIIKDTNAGTFTELQDKIDNGGSEITLDKNYSCEDGFDTGGIAISKQITIDGRGHTIDAQGKARIFYVQANNVILKNIIFKNGKTTSNGGAIYWTGPEGSVSGCTFAGNSANVHGGAIYWDAPMGSVSGSTFINNSANQGGAIYWYAPDGSADTCIFKTSSDTTYNTRILSPTLNVDNFTSFYGSGEKITFNLTTNSGIPVTNGNISISVYFKNGVWVRNYTCLSGEGWIPDLPVGLYYAIFNTEYANFQKINRTLKISDGTTFWDLNQTINADTQSEINLINNYTFNPDYDADFVDGIVINRSVIINGNGFTINAKGKARIFEVLVDNVVVKNIVFKNGNITGDGGAVHFGGSGTVENCNFTNNSADYAGGAIHMYSGSVENCIFINNTARYGGAIRFYNNGTTTNCNFTNNKVIGINPWGGAICFSNIGNITNCNFAGNTAEDGGAVCFMNNGTMSNCNFADNSADRDGGAIFWHDGAAGSVSNCIFIGNSAYNGGAIQWDGANGSVSGSTFIGNSAANSGGAIRWDGVNGSVSGSTFVGNSANVHGGAILWRGTGGSVFGSTFIGNSASSQGDAIFANRYLFGDFCWFGNTAENYNAPLPIDGNFNCVHRLFLNATVSPDTLSVFNTSNIIFKLYLYNTTSGNTSEYDNSLFKNLNLSINAVNGNTNTTNIYLEDTVQYMATKGGMGSVTASISTTSFTVYLNNLKSDSNILVESQEIEYGEEYIIQLKYNVNATGKVNITLKGKKSNLTFSDLDLNNTISLGIIPADEYNVTVIYSGDDLFINGTANGTLIVNKVKTQITADAIITTYNIDKDLVITLKDSNGNPVTNATITVDLNGAKTYITDTNGQIKVSTAGLVPQIYTAKITFAENENYKGSSADVQITVNKANPILKAKNKAFKAKKKIKKFKIALKNNIAKPIVKTKVTLKIGKKAYNAKTNSKGKATFKIKKLTKKGRYKATVAFKGNNCYNKATKTVKILIK